MTSAKVGSLLLLMQTLGLPMSYGAPEPQPGAHIIQHVFVIAMENHDANQIIGKPANAPYINTALVSNYAQATNFNDELPQSPSEPHYLWMEAGTNTFPPHHTFTTDHDPSKSNSTDSTAHLVTQIRNATNGVTWMTYQEGQDAKTGSCPITSSRFYAAKHNPFVFFQDVSGNPPSKTNGYCSAHSKPLSSLEADLAVNNVASYVFITPDLCNDMHGAIGCPKGNPIKVGDDWLRSHLPHLIDWVTKNAGVIFITWDEGEDTSKMPFLAIGPGVKPKYSGGVSYNHGSIVKSVEEIFNLPVLASVSGNNDLLDLFKPGLFP
jgi:phosphatidylinositol-3-phosphatase